MRKRYHKLCLVTLRALALCGSALLGLGGEGLGICSRQGWLAGCGRYGNTIILGEKAWSFGGGGNSKESALGMSQN